MKEILDIVSAKVLEMTESGEIQKRVEEGVVSAINKAISSQFESYGNITKQLEDTFKKNLLIDNQSLDIPSLNSIMTQVVSTNINEFYKGQAAEKLHALMKQKLEPLPNEMTINELINMICKEWHTSDHESFDDVDDSATIEIDNKYSMHGLVAFKIWKKMKGAYDSGDFIKITFSTDTKTGLSTLQGRHGATSPYYLFDVDALIFKAFAQGVKFSGLEDFDEDDCDLELKPSEY
tara:strand:- start:3449 stop:4153 length:705 start_codon:yes stop_codon:yes gene_type:complete